MSRLLIVEDEVHSGEALAYYLRSAGYGVTLADCAEKAMKAAEEHWPDLLLTDLVLRGDEDGMTIARRLQERDPELLVVAMSGLPEEEVRRRSEEADVYEICLKPLRLGKLVEMIRTALAEKAKP